MKKDFIYIGIIILLCLFGFMYINKIHNLKNEFKMYENTISALNDSITKTVNDNFVTYSKQSVQMDLSSLTNSEYFKTLNKQQQNYYKELNKIKGLLSSTQAELEMIREFSQTQNTPSTIKNDSITFKQGQVINFSNESDSSNLKYNAKITLDKPVKFDLKYKYNLNIQTSYIRQKDKSILVKYKFDDPNITVNDMNNFIIPPNTPTTKIGRWYKKNKKVIQLTSGAVIFGAGVYTGVKLSN